MINCYLHVWIMCDLEFQGCTEYNVINSRIRFKVPFFTYEKDTIQLPTATIAFLLILYSRE